MSVIGRKERLQQVRNPRQAMILRLSGPAEGGAHLCAVFECRKPAGRSTGDSLGRYCRQHLKHTRRHGHPIKPSYRASEIAPYRIAVAKWLAMNATRREVEHALAGIEQILAASGRAVEPRHLLGLPAKDRAAAIWARIRERRAEPKAILATILGVSLCIAADHQRPSHAEFRYVQVAKLLNRIGGGIVRRWEQTPLTIKNSDGVARTVERPPKVMRWFPDSSGLVLREVGRAACEAASWILHGRTVEMLAEVRALITPKRRYPPKKSTNAPATADRAPTVKTLNDGTLIIKR